MRFPNSLLIFFSAVFWVDAQFCCCPQLFSSELGFDNRFSLREWIRQWYTGRVRNIFSPLNGKHTGVHRVMMKLEIDSQWFWLLLDTGSAVTWVPADNVTIVGGGGHDPQYDNYYRPARVVRGPHFERRYGHEGGTGFVEGFYYTGPIRFSKSTCKVNLTYGAVERMKMNWEAESGIFGASRRPPGDDVAYPIMEDPETRKVIPTAMFTIILKPWTGDEYTNPREFNAGAVEIGGDGKRHCSSDVRYSEPLPGQYWQIRLVQAVRLGWTRNSAAEPNPQQYTRSATFTRVDAILDTGSPFIGLPHQLYRQLRLGGLDGKDTPRFRCNDSLVHIELSFHMSSRPQERIILKKEHLLIPQRDTDLCFMAIVPTDSVLLLGLPFYGAVGCVIHDYDAGRVGIAELNMTSHRQRLMSKNLDPKIFPLTYLKNT